MTMNRLRQWLRRLFRRDRWDRIPTITDIKIRAELQKKRRTTSTR